MPGIAEAMDLPTNQAGELVEQVRQRARQMKPGCGAASSLSRSMDGGRWSAVMRSSPSMIRR
jgi:hypothetical protein